LLKAKRLTSSFGGDERYNPLRGETKAIRIVAHLRPLCTKQYVIYRKSKYGSFDKHAKKAASPCDDVRETAHLFY
jgi:hypothetical protein